MRQSKKFEYKGEAHSLKEWSEITGIPYPTIIGRINKFNWPIGQALGYEEHEKNYPTKKFEYKGEAHSLKEWSEITGIGGSTIHARITKLGWPIGQALGYEERCFVIEYKGKTHTISEWAKITGIGRLTIHARITKLGWPIGQALGYEEHNNKYR